MIEQKRKIYIVIAGTVVAAAIVSVLIIYPAIANIRNFNTEIYNQRLEIETRYLLSHGPGRDININKIREEEAKLSSIFIKKDQELEFITSLENAAQANNLEQQIKLQPINKETTALIQSAPMQISLKGSFRDILQYLQSLEKLSYYININSINLNNPTTKKEAATAQKATSITINAEITALTYWETQ